MNFNFIPKLNSYDTVAEARTFNVDRLWLQGSEISHLIDRSYDYHSARELRWHLADRFGLPVASIVLSRMKS